MKDRFCFFFCCNVLNHLSENSKALPYLYQRCKILTFYLNNTPQLLCFDSEAKLRHTMLQSLVT